MKRATEWRLLAVCLLVPVLIFSTCESDDSPAVPPHTTTTTMPSSDARFPEREPTIAEIVWKIAVFFALVEENIQAAYPWPIMECIKRHESGDYSEHSHPWDGSGAYQLIPSTWATWSARAGHPGWAYAYLAPPEVQDAVVAYTLTHGGAGNWSLRFGFDPCTAGLPGGG